MGNHRDARPAQRDVRGPRRPDAAGDPGAALPGRGAGDRARRTVRDEPAGNLQASEGAGTRGADRARARGAVAAVPAAAAAAEGCGRLARRLPAVLGAEPGSPGRLSEGAAGEGEATWA